LAATDEEGLIMTARYTYTAAPHIRSQDSVSKINWKMAAALFPVVVASLFLSGLISLMMITVTVLGAMAAEAAAAYFWNKRARFDNGNTVFIGLLLAFMLPPSLPLWMGALGGFVAGFVGKEVFGGFAHYPFHPTLVGHVFLQVSFPLAMHQQDRSVDAVSSATPLVLMNEGFFESLPSHLELFLGRYSGAIGETSALAILIGGIFLIWQKVIRWEIPLLFVGVFIVLGPLFNYDPWASLMSGGVLFAAFFIVTDPLTTPLTRHGHRLFAVGAALMVLVIRKWSHYPEGITFAVLMMNAMTPWIDQWVRPRGSYLP